MNELLEIMARLRDPQTGCPWDRQQDFASVAPYTIEEAYEVAEAIAEGDHEELRQELGDLLFQVVFHARMAEERKLFDFQDVVVAVCEKMIRRHPHVFADAEIASAEAQYHAWERLKQTERGERDQHGVLDGVAQALPALMRAQKLQKRAAKVGFDWQHHRDVLSKIDEELEELRREMDAPIPDPEAIADECGDLLFACSNLVRHAGVDAEEAMRRTNRKFERRFRHVELRLAEQGCTPDQASQAEMEALWREAKALERVSAGTCPKVPGSEDHDR